MMFIACGNCHHTFGTTDSEVAREIENATPEQCAEWHAVL